MEAPPHHFSLEHYFSLKRRDGRLSGCGCIHVSIYCAPPFLLYAFLSLLLIENSLSVQVSIQVSSCHGFKGIGDYPDVAERYIRRSAAR